MVRAAIPAAILVMAASGASARDARSLHNIPWYLAHPAERAAVMALCRTDFAIGKHPDCANAEAAATLAWANDLRQDRIPTPEEVLSDPAYWQTNKIARAGAVAACALPGRGGMTAQECAIARASGN